MQEIRIRRAAMEDIDLLIRLRCDYLADQNQLPLEEREQLIRNGICGSILKRPWREMNLLQSLRKKGRKPYQQHFCRLRRDRHDRGKLQTGWVQFTVCLHIPIIEEKDWQPGCCNP